MIKLVLVFLFLTGCYVQPSLKTEEHTHPALHRHPVKPKKVLDYDYLYRYYDCDDWDYCKHHFTPRWCKRFKRTYRYKKCEYYFGY